LIGGLVGALIARVLFDGRLEAIFNAVFPLSISPQLIALGLGWALLLSILGGLAPAIRSARLPVAEALRQA
jgi:putative ABC transport system permease protein